MGETTGGLLFESALGRIGRPCEYGRIMPGFSVFGDEPIRIPRSDGGSTLVSGVYNRFWDGKYWQVGLLPYYVPTNPRTPLQQAWRKVYADSIVAWRGLTTEQKKSYNKRAEHKGYSGYNLFQKEYLLSH